MRPVWNLWAKKLIDLIIISEPLTVVPADYDYPIPKYPLYDYPPKLIMKQNEFFESERRLWRERMELFLSYVSNYDLYFLLYPYHKKILGDILSRFGAHGYYVERIFLAHKVRDIIRELDMADRL